VFVERLVALFRRRRLEEELDAELRSHLEMAVEWNLRKGMNAEEARREARRVFGGVGQVKELDREQRGIPMIETTVQDLRFGLRMLRRSPGFSILAIVCLTLGIGGNAAVFGWVEGILLRPYPAVAHEERLLALSGTAHGTTGFEAISWPDLDDYRKSCRLIDAFIVGKIMGTTMSIGDRAERASGQIVSSNYFEALGVHPILGRGFTPDEETGRNAHPVTVISYQLWKERFQGDPAIIGKTQVLNGVPHTIIGVGPEGFYGTFVGYSMKFWVPASMEETFEPGGYKLEDRSARWIEAFVRLKPGASREQAQEEISAVARRLEADYPDTNRGRGIQLLPLWLTPFNKANEMLPTLEIAMAVVFFVLLIACANVSNLLLVRSFARGQEMTVRLALGCGRARLVKQLLTEGLILATLAAAGGIAAAYWGRNLLLLLYTTRPGSFFNLPGELDWRVLALGAGVCVLSTLLFGLVPAMQASKVDFAAALKTESGGVVGGHGRAWVRSSLVLVQVSLSFVLLVVTCLLIKSVQGMRTASPGFSTRGVLTTGVDLLAAGYDTRRARDFEDQLLDRVESLGGVQSAAYARVLPFSFLPYSSAAIAVDGYEPARDEQPSAEFNEVSPSYFATMGILLVSGRDFSRADDENALPVAVVNQVMAAQYWRGEDPVGKRLQVKGRWLQVVGVARTSNYATMLERPKPFFYVPLRQNFAVRTVLIIRTPESAGAMATALVREIHALDPNLAPLEVISMREQVDRRMSSQQIAVTLLSVYGGLALLLAAIGLYGVMSYTVSQSRRELGVRMALGAGVPELLRLVLSQGLALTGGGILLGAAAALGLTRLLGYMLYQVSPRDPLAFVGALVVMTVASLAACLLPAWRAARTDPVTALRA